MFSDDINQLILHAQPLSSVLKQSGRRGEKARVRTALLPSAEDGFMALPDTASYVSAKGTSIPLEHGMWWQAKEQTARYDKSTIASAEVHARVRTPSPEYHNPWMDHIVPPPLRVVLLSHSSPSFTFPTWQQSHEKPSAPARVHAEHCKTANKARCQSFTKQVPSKGSAGHPKTCAEPCKYFRKKKGCKDGAECDRCHVCNWTICNAREEAHRVRRNRTASMNK